MSRALYDRPRIVRHQTGIANEFNRQKISWVDQIDGVRIEDLVTRYGSPLFVFSERDFRRVIRRFRDAFLQRYPRVRFAWSYKTNHLDAICGVLHQEGWDAEVVSDLEYAMARRSGIPGKRIICNGAFKSAAWCKQAEEEGALIQIDHLDEIDLLEKLTAKRRKPLPVGLRINLSVDGFGPMWSRFGFNLENGEAMDAVVRLDNSRGMQLAGLHCHLGTFITQPEVYQKALRKLCDFTSTLERVLGRSLTFVNMGGGLPPNHAPTDAPAAGEPQPDIEGFAAPITQEMHRAFDGRDPMPNLVIESGRALIDEAGSLIATVVGTRRLPNGERSVVVDAGLNILYTSHWFQHAVVIAQDVPGALEPTTIHGPLCMNIDTLRRGVPLPPLEAGHRILFRSVGAYNVTQWMQFSQLRPAVVMIGEDGTVDLIRRAETIDDVKGPENVPARYAAPR